MAAEDRCHLNGLAMQEGRARYVTAVSQSDVADGWRDRRGDGGCVIDVASGEIVVAGLSMPHSPRLHNGRLWLLDSGTGYFGYVDPEKGNFERVAFCPGYLRGLSFIGNFAVVGLSRPRGNRTFSGLALDDNLAKADSDARCGLMVIDLKSGDIVHWLRIDGVVEELYDVVILPGAVRPMALGFKTDEIRRVLNVGEPGALVPN
ncbi:TIGR03032 family protein [Pelagibius litoralis]|uniref:TIGR03032 family protein n=1 Tax=Pelagibius litoralis TaxID=374515 RepID=A0A967EYB2_9PROT|nr:TIGR03032 family protein [Pelagibius litoralis]